MYFALIGHDDPLLELPKQVHALEMYWVDLPARTAWVHGELRCRPDASHWLQVSL